jgi:hypothetical protein
MTVKMDRLGDQFLPCAALALNKHGGIGTGYKSNKPAHLADLLAPSDYAWNVNRGPDQFIVLDLAVMFAGFAG